jgi:orotate phosphoribosyltransferase
MAIRESGVQFDVIFGPAYKGIPLATALGMAWFQLYGENKAVCYNRKEVKDHGEVSCQLYYVTSNRNLIRLSHT